MILFNPNAGFFEERHRIRVGVRFDENDVFNSGVYNHFCAKNTRLMRAVKRCAGGLNPVNRGLNDGVLLGVNRAAFFMHRSGRNVLLVSDTTDIQTMRKASGRAVVAGR